ncbi:MAG: hypothetical protein J6T38_04855 [Bacteroidaceae bacterium]|nr:hypothetical protein [Bacteroidaceae bacterium]
MKRFNLFLMALAIFIPAVSMAQTKYTERLDSIVTDLEYGLPVKYVFHYDVDGRLVEQLYYGKRDGKWGDKEQRIFVYDEQGRLTTVTTYSLDEKNVEPSRERVEYDDKGRVSLWVYEVFDKERGEWYASMHSGERKYEYDAQGNQISDTYGISSPFLNGKFRVIRKSEKEYDKKGRLITQRDYKRPYTNEDDEMKLNVTHHYTYDKQGRLKSVVRESEDDYYNKEEHYTYDKQGRLISFVRDGGTFIPQKEEYYYDTHGNLIQIATFLLFEGEWDHDRNQTFTYDQDTPVSSVMGLTCPEVLNTEMTLRKKLNLTSKPLSVSLDLGSPKRYHASDEVVYYYSDIDTPSSLATNIHLSQQDSVKRNEYLVKLAREVVLNFGPGYYRENMNPEVSAIRMYLDSTHVERFPEDRKNIGRKYYVVTFPYDHTQEQLEWGYAAKVEIWEDDGEPKGVMFGHGLGYHFTTRPYREWVKTGIKEDEIMPYQHYTIKPEAIVYQ